MPALANARHEAFARNRAAGLTQYDSYVNAGFEGNPSAASQIERRPEVKSRIQELIAERQEARTAEERDDDTSVSGLDRDWILRELKQNVKNAQTSGQISAANKAIELIMDIVGLTPKKGKQPEGESDDKKPGGFNDDHMSKALDKIAEMARFEDIPDLVEPPPPTPEDE